MSEFDGSGPRERLASLPGEVVSELELSTIMEKRFGLSKDELKDLALGEATVEKTSELAGVERGMYAYSAEAYLTAETEEAREKAWHNFWNDVSAQLFEAVSHSGHLEEFTNEIESESGDAIAINNETIGSVYIRDLMLPTYKWRAQLSFTELLETVEVAELSHRGELKDKVYINASCFAYNVPLEQAARVGYRPENQKGYLRMQTDEDGKRVLQPLSYSHLLPGEVSELAQILGVKLPKAESTKDALRQGILIPKEVFASIGGIAGIAGLLDGIKQRATGLPHYFGNKVDRAPSYADYDNIRALSQERKERAKQVTGQYAEQVLLSYMAFRNGIIDMKTAMTQMGNSLLEARSLVFRGDRQLAVEQHGEAVASQIDHVNQLYKEDRYAEALIAEKALQKELGDIFVCGLQIQLDQEGNPIGPDGEPLDCKELKNGDVGVCPGCRHMVSIIVDPRNKEKVYCPRSSCSLSRSGGRVVKTSKEVSHDDAKSMDMARVLIDMFTDKQFSLAA